MDKASSSSSSTSSLNMAEALRQVVGDDGITIDFEKLAALDTSSSSISSSSYSSSSSSSWSSISSSSIGDPLEACDLGPGYCDSPGPGCYASEYINGSIYLVADECQPGYCPDERAMRELEEKIKSNPNFAPPFTINWSPCVLCNSSSSSYSSSSSSSSYSSVSSSSSSSG